jgi:high-affinity iron transporter
VDVLPTLVIGLREGLEASLIIGIIAAFLGKQQRRDALRQMWIGVAAAVLLCLIVAVGLQVVAAELPGKEQEALETIVAVFAIVMITYMILRIGHKSHGQKQKAVEGEAASALALGSARALVIMAFLAVLREGFETAVFLLATLEDSHSALSGAIGALLGILIAVAIGYGIYRGGIRVDLKRFFSVTRVVLLIVAAGLTMKAVHSAHEAGWLNAGQAQALDLSRLVRPDTVVQSVLTGVLGIQAKPVVAEVIGWLAYTVPMLICVMVRRPARQPVPPVPPVPSAERPAPSDEPRV